MNINNKNNKNIAIIGGGWYGCHIALYLKKNNYNITIYEKEKSLFKGVSGYYGIRLHIGLHYPRSELTRKECIEGFNKFLNTYPELVIYNEYSFYGIGINDAEGLPSRTNLETFKKICSEIPNTNVVNHNKLGFKNLQILYNVFEPSLKMEVPEEYFMKKFKEQNIKLYFNYEIKFIDNNKINDITYDWIINCTHFKSLIPKTFPLEIEIIYQPCLTLYYKDNEPNNKPFSFIVMDGWFPCIMPYENTWNTPRNRLYILSNAKYKILGSFKTVNEANDIISMLSKNNVYNNLRPLFEKEILKYYPKFKDRFKYHGYNSAISTKIKSQTEFRSSFIFPKDKTIYVFSGKINNIFHAAENILDIIKYNKFNELYDLKNELNLSNNITKTTCDLQTYKEIFKK